MLQHKSLYQDKDSALFNSLVSTRVVAVLSTIKAKELDELERLGPGGEPNADIVEICVRKGILIQNESCIEFSSPVMWRSFVKLRVGHIVRVLHTPEALLDWITRTTQAIDYDSIHQTLGRSVSSDFRVERAWQMEFYKAAHCSTPSTFATKLDELIERFAPDGRYSMLGLSNFCLIDFRCVASARDNATKEKIAADMHRCDKFFVLCYDAGLSNVAVSNSQMRVVFQCQHIVFSSSTEPVSLVI